MRQRPRVVTRRASLTGDRRGPKRAGAALGRVIRVKRAEAHLSLRTVARRMRKSQRWLSQLEQGSGRLRVIDVARLARILKTTELDLYSRTLQLCARFKKSRSRELP